MLKIIANLVEPVIPSSFDGNINIDALLMWANAKHLQINDGGIVPIPIDTLGAVNNLPVYECTRAFFGDSEHAQIYKHRRGNERRDFLLKRKITSVERLSGYTKDSRVAFKAIVPKLMKIHWYCNGSKDEILSLLTEYVTHLGKGRNCYGRVSSWNVEISDSDLIISDYRVMPVQLIDKNEVTMRQTFTPPYWDRTKAGLCYVAK